MRSKFKKALLENEQNKKGKKSNDREQKFFVPPPNWADAPEFVPLSNLTASPDSSMHLFYF